MLTQARLKEVLHYDQDTGLFTWKVRTSNRIRVGEVAGAFSEKLGYILIGIDGTRHYAHRLAWLYVYGQFPEKMIDHEDTDGRNNRISNLRVATRTQNLSNHDKNSNNTSGIKGISWLERDQAWIVHCAFGDKKLRRQVKDKDEALRILNNFREKVVGEYARI